MATRISLIPGIYQKFNNKSSSVPSPVLDAGAAAVVRLAAGAQGGADRGLRRGDVGQPGDRGE